jgi:iduronate 2-sulfatase
MFGRIPADATAQIESAQAGIKNVLFIISDDLKASVLGCYGDQVCQTPNIDRLAQQGVVFERAYCQGTWCAPSRQSFMHSRYQGIGKTNLGQHLQSHGLYTARVGKIYHMRVPGDIIAGTNGNDVASTWTERFNSPGQEAHTPGDYACLNLNIFTTELQGRESTKMPNRPFVTVEYEGDGSDQADHKSATKAIELLRQQKQTGKPFLLAVGLVRPHYPMVAPTQYFEPYPWEQIQLPEIRENDEVDIPKMGLGKTRSDKNPIGKYPDNQKRMWAGYYASVSFMDAQVGRIVAELERLGLRDSTAIVFTSDHGYHLGEHGFWQKSNLHEEVTRVPLIISAPGFNPGTTTSPVELVDLFPTFSDLLGYEVPKEVEGKTLVPVLRDPTARVRDAALSIHNGYSLRSDRWAYLRYHDGSEELYDMNSDGKQFTNLAASPEYTDALAENRAALDTRLAQHRLDDNKTKNEKPTR